MSLILHIALFLVSFLVTKVVAHSTLIGSVSLHVSSRSMREFFTLDIRQRT
jgi:hypothetical protein